MIFLLSGYICIVLSLLLLGRLILRDTLLFLFKSAKSWCVISERVRLDFCIIAASQSDLSLISLSFVLALASLHFFLPPVRIINRYYFQQYVDSANPTILK